RDFHVPGVQTCALPIWPASPRPRNRTGLDGCWSGSTGQRPDRTPPEAPPMPVFEPAIIGLGMTEMSVKPGGTAQELASRALAAAVRDAALALSDIDGRSEEHTPELQSRGKLV